MNTVQSDTPAIGLPAGDTLKRDRRKDRLMRISSVIARTGLSRTTIYRRELRGEFPKREKLSARSIAWYESDIDDFVANPMGYRAV
ncbi:AlpA family phage regulatory protein [Sphingobium sp. D43FB]|uniref:helix-turn-helix transcriptional regulator n=1 Tax=Sphingobium sp. D43FB TaxID=2017595 RepID=UPI000BB559B6|nr:AlpA family transcriptional regulator [Sphingobium sp. D43FB]